MKLISFKNRRVPQAEWVGGRVRTSAHVAEGGGFYPDLLVWIEMPEGLIVGSEAVSPFEPELDLGLLLERCMESPAEGKPRRPNSIRVATEPLAREVRASIGDSIPIRVLPTPEVDEAQRSFEAFLEEDDEPNYLGSGAIAEPVMNDFFRIVAAMSEVRPWEVIGDHLLRLDIPALGVDGVCVSFMDGSEDSGILLFPSLDACVSFGEEISEDGPKPGQEVDFGTTWLGLTFLAADEVPESMLAEASEHGWELPTPLGFPLLQQVGRDGIPIPLTEKDVRVATAAALSASAFVIHKGDTFASRPGGTPEPTMMSFTDAEGNQIFLSGPYEEYDLTGPDEFDAEEFPPDPGGRATSGAPSRPGAKRAAKSGGSGAGSGRATTSRGPGGSSGSSTTSGSPGAGSGRATTSGSPGAGSGRATTSGSAGPGSLRLTPSGVEQHRGSAGFGSPLGPAKRSSSEFRPRASRNAPCPCGSGKKYKLCCLETDRAGAETVHQRDRRLVDEMHAFAHSVLYVTWPDVTEDFADPVVMIEFAAPWSVYVAPVGEHPIVKWYLESGSVHDPQDALWLDAQQNAWLSVWEVHDVKLGEGLLVRDALTKVEYRITERLLTETIRPGMHILGRMVEFGGDAFMCGLYPRPLPAPDAADVVETMRKRLRRKSAVPPERLREFKHARYLLATWEDAVSELDDHLRQRPRIRDVRGRDVSVDQLVEELRRTVGSGFVGKLGGEAGRRLSGSDELDPADATELVLAFKRRHYAEWIDIPVPALGNVTPREAARSAGGRRRLEALISDMALTESRGDPETAYDFGELRKMLGLKG